MTTNYVRWPARMNPTDALFWSMDRIPELRSTIGALVILEHPPSREAIRAEFLRQSDHLPRMRQRVVEVPFNLAPPEWIEDDDFDLDYHVRYLAVPSPGGFEELLAEVSPLYATALDRDRPLWEAYVAEGLMDGRGALLLKMHHCLTDGVGGSQLFTELLGQRDPGVGRRPRREPHRSASASALVWRALQDNAAETISSGETLVRTVVAAAQRPLATLRQALAAVRGFGRELLVPRAASPLHGKRSLSRQLATFEMSLREIDAVRNRFSATNNDIVLTIVAGAMHRWHTGRGVDVHELRTLVPVSLRGPEEAQAGNRLALLAVSLPTGEPNPLRRLRAIQQRVGRFKEDRRAALYPLLARLLIAMPSAVAERLGRQQTNRTNFVCTNIPGPRNICYLAGAAIEKMYPYAPLVGDHPVAIALYSYRETMCVGLDVDPLAMPDLPHFRDALQESYAEVLNLGRQSAVGPRRRRGVSRRRPSRNVSSRLGPGSEATG